MRAFGEFWMPVFTGMTTRVRAQTFSEPLRCKTSRFSIQRKGELAKLGVEFCKLGAL